MKKTIWFSKLLLPTILILHSITLLAQAPKNINLRASMSFGPQTLAGCWHYEAAGKSYALAGGSLGMLVIDVTVPDSPHVVLQVPGIDNLWREIKVEGQYAYITTEGTDSTGILNGIQIVNLSYLPDSAPSKIYKGDAAILNLLQSAHSITSSGEYIYINGHNIQSLGRGVLICSIADPWNPVYIGAVTNNYCHDSYVRGDTIWTSDILAGIFSVYNITDRSNPILLATQQTPGNFNHNSWLSDDGNTLFTADERANVPLASFDVSDLSNITLLDTYYTNNFPTSEVHNVRVLNDFLINPSYGSQLTLVDAARPSNLIEIGNYTTGTHLLWDADPYLSSGIIVATDMNPGVFYVFDPVYQRACYLEGIITDSVSGIPLPSATIKILSTSIQKTSNGSGDYYTGTADPGTYDVLVTRQGYAAKTANGVVLNTGLVTNLNFALRPLGAGLNSNAQSDSFIISPNPFQDQLRVIKSTDESGSLTVFNILGERMQQISLSRGTETINLNTQSLAEGVYVLQIETAHSNFYRKFVKQ